MNLKNRFIQFVSYRIKNSLNLGKNFVHILDIIKADSNFTDLLALDAQETFGIINMDNAIPAARTGDAFQNTANHKRLTIYRTIFISGHQYNRVADFNLHPFGNKFRNQNFSLCQ